MDMSGPYRSAASEYLPGLPVVFDRFHVMQMVTKSVDEVRKRQGQTLSDTNRKLLKGSRFLLLSNYHNLSEKGAERLGVLLEVNKPLFIAHSLKEQLRLLWNLKDKKDATKFLLKWLMAASETCTLYRETEGNTSLEPIERLISSLIRHHEGILNFFDHRITNGRIEGVNNKIKTLKRQAYGYRDKRYFELRLYHLHAQKTQLAG